MSYVVKAMCYLDDRGLGHPSLEHAKKHEDYEFADAVAQISNGRIVEIIDQKDRKIVRTKIEAKNRKVPKKANQAWMRKE
ncbi:hypothetical protein P7D58_00535 [Enterococcus avium]|uniref:hypothetical protein n=1 Tax=Enterococcus avium TaxID=33945 RepID=UPI00288D766F|nr:hypothetical protein [Enterococcus avium]MDT2392138.1 hypothetical protein [Enterococcus avium]MDT2416740.1 hypothetical protein [Enterococcus avium]MDT2429486.1 hypothetical protein [Enterococcus avium]MDT2438472.1 hypothetical protein [Enterococcus avium]MDT2451346.1 hypothetical protein [Enterococcus avium]